MYDLPGHMEKRLKDYFRNELYCWIIDDVVGVRTVDIWYGLGEVDLEVFGSSNQQIHEY